MGYDSSHLRQPAPTSRPSRHSADRRRPPLDASSGHYVGKNRESVTTDLVFTYGRGIIHVSLERCPRYFTSSRRGAGHTIALSERLRAKSRRLLCLAIDRRQRKARSVPGV